jgi:hypothetical protein
MKTKIFVILLVFILASQSLCYAEEAGDAFDIDKDNVDVYQLDEYYWQHLWYYPDRKSRPGYCPLE